MAAKNRITYVIVEHYNEGQENARRDEIAETNTAARAEYLIGGLYSLYTRDGYSHLTWTYYRLS